MRRWDAQSGKPLGVLRGHAPHVTDVAWSPDGKLLGSAGSDLIIWNAATDKPLGGPRPYSAPIAWVGGSKQLAARSSVTGRLSLLDAISGESVAEFEPGLPFTLGLAASPDGKWIAAASYDPPIYIWNVEEPHLSKTIASAPFGAGAPVWNALSWSPKASALAALACDGVIRIWNPSTGALLATLVALRDGGYLAHFARRPLSRQPKRRARARLRRRDRRRRTTAPLARGVRQEIRLAERSGPRAAGEESEGRRRFAASRVIDARWPPSGRAQRQQHELRAAAGGVTAGDPAAPWRPHPARLDGEADGVLQTQPS